jgi:hypothetical protein
MTINLQSRLVVLVLVCWPLAACHTTQQPVTREVLLGSYTYVSKDPASRPTDYNLNHLVLQSDGQYDLVQGGTSKSVSHKKGLWKLEPGMPGNPPWEVVLDHASYPIEIKKNEVRLLVDLDVGTWWVKVK